MIYYKSNWETKSMKNLKISSEDPQTKLIQQKQKYIKLKNSYFYLLNYIVCRINMNSGNIQEAPLSFKIILLGDSSVGKTTFVRQYIDHNFSSKTKPTCCVDFVVKRCQVDQFTVKLNIFDTAGQQRYRSLTRSYIKGTDAVLFMYDMTKRQSFLNVEEWVQYMQSQSQTKDEVLVLVGTKKDLIDDVVQSGEDPAKIFSLTDKDQIKQFVSKYRFTFKFQTSAKTNLNIDLVFQQLSRNLIYNSLQRKKMVNPIKEDQWSVILKRDKDHLNNEDDKNNCC